MVRMKSEDAYVVEIIGESIELVNGSCGLAETENTEKIRVIATAMMVDFIME